MSKPWFSLAGFILLGLLMYVFFVPYHASLSCYRVSQYCTLEQKYLFRKAEENIFAFKDFVVADVEMEWFGNGILKLTRFE